MFLCQIFGRRRGENQECPKPKPQRSPLTFTLKQESGLKVTSSYPLIPAGHHDAPALLQQQLEDQDRQDTAGAKHLDGDRGSETEREPQMLLTGSTSAGLSPGRRRWYLQACGQGGFIWRGWSDTSITSVAWRCQQESQHLHPRVADAKPPRHACARMHVCTPQGQVMVTHIWKSFCFCFRIIVKCPSQLQSSTMLTAPQ